MIWTICFVALRAIGAIRRITRGRGTLGRFLSGFLGGFLGGVEEPLVLVLQPGLPDADLVHEHSERHPGIDATLVLKQYEDQRFAGVAIR